MLIIELSIEKRALQNIQNDCYEGLSDSCRVHQIRFRPGLRPGPRWGSSRRSPRPLVGWGGGGGHPLPISPPLDAFGVSVSSPAATRPRRLQRLVPKTPSDFFIWIRPWICRSNAQAYLCDTRAVSAARSHVRSKRFLECPLIAPLLEETLLPLRGLSLHGRHCTELSMG